MGSREPGSLELICAFAARIGVMTPLVRRSWGWLLELCFGLLCLRFLSAVLMENRPDIWPTMVLLAGSFGLGCWRPSAGLFAFATAMPLLAGIYIFIPGCAAAPSLVFSALSLGVGLRQMVTRRSTNESGGNGAGLIVDAFASVVLVSLAWQIWNHHLTPAFWLAFFGRSEFGFGDPFYFLTSAFLWLQGIFYFRQLQSAGRSMFHWAKPVFVIAGITVTLFFVFQSALQIPAPARIFHHLILETFLPFEDSHAFGSVAVGVFAFVTAFWLNPLKPRAVLLGIATAVPFLLVASSWSRAAWMSGIIVIMVIAALKLPARRTLTLAGIIVVAIVAFESANSDKWTADYNPFLYRLGNIMRLDQPRLDLYHKAIGMAETRPLTGFGIGSCYRTTPRFARPGDPLADVPDFAHNFLLQIATELGIPVAFLIAWLVGGTLWQGIRETVRASNRRAAEPLDRPTDRQSDRLILFATTLALGTYLLTQMTANSLNVYASNQFFFWFLMAAVLAGAKAVERRGVAPSDGEMVRL